MARSTVHYAKPRKVNPVSVVLAIVAVILGYLGYVLIPLGLRRQEAYRVLEEKGSEFSGSRSRFMEVPAEREALHMRMRRDLQTTAGINDPKWQTWIEIKSPQQVDFGVRYSDTIHWPGDVVKPWVRENEVVYRLELLPPH